MVTSYFMGPCMSKQIFKPIEIFRIGQRVDSQGRTWNFSSDVLDEVIQEYDPAVFKAPLTIGHPKVNEPAYGWVNGLNRDSVNAELIQATPINVEPAFAAMVNEQRFPKVSASFFTPDHPANPKPGKWYLRHVAFLGAAAPAIPGIKPASLDPANFSANDDDLVTIEFNASDFDASGFFSGVLRNLRDFLLTKFGAEDADKVVPNYLVADVERMNVRNELTQSSPGFAAPANEEPPSDNTGESTVTKKTDDAADKQTADFAARESSLAAREQAIADKEAAAKRAAITAFADKVVGDRRVGLDKRDGLIEFMATLDDDRTVSFSAEDGKNVSQPSATWFREFVEGLSPEVNFSECGAPGDEPVDFSENPGALAKAATTYQAEMAAKGVQVSATEAVKHIQKGASA